MNIKSLLLGSAAALVAVSGARAADAIVAAEPEPVEYVRVCDAFGTGYFYIPGTETCLRVGGYVRLDVAGGDYFAKQAFATGDDTYSILARGQIDINAKTETELGTLGARITFNGNVSNANNAGYNATVTATAPVLNYPGYAYSNGVVVDNAYITLGGLLVGYEDSFFSTIDDGRIINDDLIDPTPGSNFQARYVYNGGAWWAGISLEAGGNDTFRQNFFSGVYSYNPASWGIDDYMPHVVGGIGATFGMFDIGAVVAYDSRSDIAAGTVIFPAPAPVVGAFATTAVQRGGWAGKIRAKATFNDAFSAFVELMYGENSSAYTTWSNGVAGKNTFAATGGLSYMFTDKAKFNLQGFWADGGAGNQDMWAVGANVNYTLVPGLVITPEVVYKDSGATDQFGAMVRMQRSF